MIPGYGWSSKFDLKRVKPPQKFNNNRYQKWPYFTGVTYPSFKPAPRKGSAWIWPQASWPAACFREIFLEGGFHVRKWRAQQGAQFKSPKSLGTLWHSIVLVGWYKSLYYIDLLWSFFFKGSFSPIVILGPLHSATCFPWVTKYQAFFTRTHVEQEKHVYIYKIIYIYILI